eukprot:Skav217485  [mRNA]  locus=scaffold1397:110835:111265:- [translate_table: standard]
MIAKPPASAPSLPGDSRASPRPPRAKLSIVPSTQQARIFFNFCMSLGLISSSGIFHACTMFTPSRLAAAAMALLLEPADICDIRLCREDREVREALELLFPRCWLARPLATLLR